MQLELLNSILDDCLVVVVSHVFVVIVIVATSCQLVVQLGVMSCPGLEVVVMATRSHPSVPPVIG
jgi:hypothetical protein